MHDCAAGRESGEEMKKRVDGEEVVSKTAFLLQQHFTSRRRRHLCWHCCIRRRCCHVVSRGKQMFAVLASGDCVTMSLMLPPHVCLHVCLVEACIGTDVTGEALNP